MPDRATPNPVSRDQGALVLRPVALDDAENLLAILGDPKVAFWLRRAGQSGPFTLEECRATARRMAAHWTAHGFGTSLAFAGERCVGWSLVHYTQAAGRSEVEIGWSVASDLWRQGIATDLGSHALACASDAGFDRIVAYTRVDNAASRRVMEKLGLRYERDFEHAGLPHVLYANSR